MTPEQIAELEALAAYVVRLPSGVERANAKAELALFVTHNLPVILAALKAQQPDDAMVRDAIYQLAYHQQQADMDGCMVTVSGQALDEVLAALKAQQPDDAMVERVATVLAPFVCRPVHNGDCDDIAAGQSHARYVARAAIAAMQESRDAED